MTIAVYKNPDDSFSLIIDEPHKSWVDRIARALQADTTLVISLALTTGLIKTIAMFVEPNNSQEEDNEHYQ